MKAWVALVAAVVVAGGGYEAWTLLRKPADKPAPVAAIPVATALAKQGTVPVYLRGIGTVQALNGIEIHPQVGGILLSVLVHEGDTVHANQILAVIDPKPYQAALDKVRAQRTQDQAQLENAQTDQKRYTTLARSDFASRQQVDTQASTVARLAGTVAGDDASIDEAQINLGYTVVRSPIEGQVGLRRVDPGNLITANASGPGILSVLQIQPIAVVFTLAENNLPAIRRAIAAGPVPVLADTSDTRTNLARGLLLSPNNAVDPASGTISLKAQFDNAGEPLTPGQFVSVRLQSGTVAGVSVPHDAVQHGQSGLYVYMVKPDKTADLHPVEVAYDDGAVAVLSKGLADGATVVVSGQSRVGQGTLLASRDDTQAETKPE